jgi:hypothetical protein
MSNFLDSVLQAVQSVFGAPKPSQPVEPVGQTPTPVTRKVALIIFNPTIPSAGGKRMVDVMNWNKPDTLVQQYISDLNNSSGGYAHFTIVDRLEVDGFPTKIDGFAYTPAQYMACTQVGSGFHAPDTADYNLLLQTYNIFPRINSGAIDEVWMFGFPYCGFYESRMVGPGAFFCNSDPIITTICNRRFIMMGFNYQRGVGEMLESFAHRVESMVGTQYRNLSGDLNLWSRFELYDKTAPGKAEVGSVHYAPNSLTDYDWGNTRYVASGCDRWLHFPDLTAAPRMVNCSEWGDGDIRLHHLWWLEHLPRITGAANNVSYNWWKYAVDPNTVT